MIKASKKKDNFAQNIEKCQCRPVCKNRRREWKGEVLKTSAESLAEKEKQKEDQKKCATKLSKDRPDLQLTTPRKVFPSVDKRKSNIVKICEAPIADTAPTPCLEFSELAKRLGAWDSVKNKCAFCSCVGCCLCAVQGYTLPEEDSEHRRGSMRHFDNRVRADCKIMRIMYNKL